MVKNHFDTNNNATSSPKMTDETMLLSTLKRAELALKRSKKSESKKKKELHDDEKPSSSSLISSSSNQKKKITIISKRNSDRLKKLPNSSSVNFFDFNSDDDDLNNDLIEDDNIINEKKSIIDDDDSDIDDDINDEDFQPDDDEESELNDHSTDTDDNSSEEELQQLTSTTKNNKPISKKDLQVIIKKQLHAIHDDSTSVFETIPDINNNVSNNVNIPIEIETLQTNNIHAIRELNKLQQKRPGGRKSLNNSISDTNQSPFKTLVGNYNEKFEQGLKSLPNSSFQLPKTFVSSSSPSSSSDHISNDQNDHHQEISLDYLAEIISNSKDCSIESQGSDFVDHLPFIECRPRSQEELMMREPLPHERPCINGDSCEGNFIGKTEQIDGFTLVSYESSESLGYFNANKKWPPHIPPQKCVICERKSMHDQWCQSMSSSSIRSDRNPTRFTKNITYYNKIGPGEYSGSDTFACDSTQINGSILPVVMHSRIKYRIIYSEFNGQKIKFYQQNLTEPQAFRVWRTRQV